MDRNITELQRRYRAGDKSVRAQLIYTLVRAGRLPKWVIPLLAALDDPEIEYDFPARCGHYEIYSSSPHRNHNENYRNLCKLATALEKVKEHEDFITISALLTESLFIEEGINLPDYYERYVDGNLETWLVGFSSDLQTNEQTLIAQIMYLAEAIAEQDGIVTPDQVDRGNYLFEVMNEVSLHGLGDYINRASARRVASAMTLLTRRNAPGAGGRVAFRHSLLSVIDKSQPVLLDRVPGYYKVMQLTVSNWATRH